MNIEVYDDWYVRTNGRLGPWNVSQGTPTDEQKYNATKVYEALRAMGWSLSAIAGALGNMQHESTINPAYIQQTNRWRLPNAAADLSDVPNSVMQNFYDSYYGLSTRGFGIGIVQWDGKGITRQKYVGYCMNEGYVWYSGDAAMARIRYEKTNNIQWQVRTLYGYSWNWNNYVTNTRTPEESARIWLVCYEVAADGLSERQQNARYWYDYFNSPQPPIPPDPPAPPPDDWIEGSDFARLALAYDPDVTGVQIPYSTWDCIAFVNAVWQDIDIVHDNGWSLPNGTNSFWRSTTTYNTRDPFQRTPTDILYYKEDLITLQNYWGQIPAGTLLFHRISEEGPPPIPSQYEGDGIGNYVHVGIYCGNNTVMQSGGRDAGSIPGGGVHRSTFDPEAWNYGAFVCWVDCVDQYEPEPLPQWFYLWYNQKRKEVTRFVKRKF